MTTKIVERAKHAKEQGYIYMYSVVRSVYRTTYYHVVLIDDIIATGKWIPAPVGEWPTADDTGVWHGRLGVRQLPPHSIPRHAKRMQVI